MAVSASSLTLQLATFRSQALGALFDSSSSATDFGSIFQAASDSMAGSPAATTGKNGLSATGRNTSLYDPESAYDMMSLINRKDVDYKAQYAELSAMKSDVAGLASAAQGLGTITTGSGDADIQSRLQAFVDQYNAWDKRFDADVAKGGLLEGTQAAQVARWELEQSVSNRFNGAAEGFNGLADLGIAIDPATGQASLDPAKLRAALAGNRQGAVDTLQEFAAGFAQSANLLNSSGNFIPNQLSNLDSAIHYIDANISSWRSEFGTGNAAAPNAQTAAALAAYEDANAITA